MAAAGPHHQWFGKAFESEAAREALLTSIEAGVVATAIAVVLGSLASLAVGRRRFFGRETISFLVILPIALPGIVTGVALSNTFTQVLGVSLSLLTVIIGHATFCIVVVYNNVVARLRRTSGSFEEASADLGADPWQTFRFVTFPSMKAPSPPAPCSPSPSPSTRSSSPTSRSAPAKKPCRSGSSQPLPPQSSCRSSTPSR